MNSTKKIAALLLALIMAAGLISLPTRAALESDSTFTDITDPNVAEAVEILHTMGVINGDGKGKFNPDGNLTRAHFCTLAILLMGRGDEVPRYEITTTFTDVLSDHWAQGYINLASKIEIPEGSGNRLVSGTGKDGKFNPDGNMTYGMAVTFALRVLGYTAESSVNWPYGAVALAPQLGLSDDLPALSANAPITRGQAAILFRNMLTAKPKDSKTSYINTLGTAYENTVYYSAGEVTGDGQPAMKFSGIEEPVAAAHHFPSDSFLGHRGTAVLDGSEKLLAFIPERDQRSRTVTVVSTSGTKLSGEGGVTVTVPSDTKVYRGGVESKWGMIFGGLNRAGLRVTVYYAPSGSIDYIYAGSASKVSGNIAVAREEGLKAFSSIISGERCTVIKNGLEVDGSAIKPYDVGMYDAAGGTLYVTDFRVAAVYEQASPNPAAPEKITLLGKELELADCAYDTLGNVGRGVTVMALFAPNGKIAQLLPNTGLGSTAMGVVAEGSSGSGVTISVINAPEGLETVSGTLQNGIDAGSYMGELVTFGTATVAGSTCLRLTKVFSGAYGDFDVAARKVGRYSLAENAVIFERAGAGGYLTRISTGDLSEARIPSAQVTSVHLNSENQADVIILENVTGDRFVYGLVSTRADQGYIASLGGGEGTTVDVTVTTVKYYEDGEEKSVEVLCDSLRGGGFGGVAVSGFDSGYSNISVPRAAAYATLSSVKDLTQDDIDVKNGVVYLKGTRIPISSSVRCYNKRYGFWYESLDECWLASNSFTVYYDRTPTTGAKARIIVVE